MEAGRARVGLFFFLDLRERRDEGTGVALRCLLFLRFFLRMFFWDLEDLDKKTFFSEVACFVEIWETLGLGELTLDVRVGAL